MSEIPKKVSEIIYEVIRRAEAYNPWILVSERLPENTDDVWVCSTKVKTLRKVGIGFYSKNCAKWIWFDRSKDTPTHWKPIILPDGEKP